MKSFSTPARHKGEDGEINEDGWAPEARKEYRFDHDGREVVFYEPGLGQQAILMSMGGREMDTRQVGNFIAMFFELMDDSTARYFNTRLMDFDDPFSDPETEGGLFDVWEALTEEWSERPTKKPSDYAAPRSRTGQKSTAKPRGKAPIRSRSAASTDS